MILKHNIKNFFIVTKLQSIKGFTGTCTNIQVSVDPMNEKHLVKTLKNVETLLQRFDLNIILRIRSCSTNDFLLNLFQHEAVLFANQYDLPVLETRLRFRNKYEALEKYDLVEKNYRWHRSFFRPKDNIRFLTKVKKRFVCDESGKKCAGCLNCIRLLKEVSLNDTSHWEENRADLILVA